MIKSPMDPCDLFDRGRNSPGNSASRLGRWAGVISRRLCAAVCFALILTAPAIAASQTPCDRLEHKGTGYVVCTFDLRNTDMRLFLNNGDGRAFGSFRALIADQRDKGFAVPFAMNGGMYHRDRSPVGLYIEDGKTVKKAANGPGPGNFHMRPNGIFWIDGEVAGVSESRAFTKSGRAARFATQSGPMLVIDNALHPRFIEGSEFRKVRNGVGVRGANQVILAISESRVNFHDFATLFRDRLKCPNALFLDGTISSIHAPAAGRTDFLFPMGPIIAVIEKPEMSQ